MKNLTVIAMIIAVNIACERKNDNNNEIINSSKPETNQAQNNISSTYNEPFHVGAVRTEKIYSGEIFRNNSEYKVCYPSILVSSVKGTFDSDLKLGIKQDGKTCIHEAEVFLETKEFQGASPYNIPFVGYIRGLVKELYVNNEKIDIKLSPEYYEELFFRLKIPLEIGYNRIPVKIVGQSGNVVESYLELTMEAIKEDKAIEININDK
jgi:hypothetical protein